MYYILITDYYAISAHILQATEVIKMKLNTGLYKKAVSALIPALIGCVFMCSCAALPISRATPAETESSESSTAAAVTSQVTVTETSSVTAAPSTEIKTTEKTTAETSTTAKPSTTGSTAPETQAPESSATKAEETEKESQKRFSISDLVPSLTLPTIKQEVQTKADGSVDFACFDNSAFVGNSRLLAVENYGFCDNVYAKVGLNVNTVFTERCSGSSVPVIDELKGKRFDKVFLMFGDNECGWGSMNAFVNQYKKVVSAVQDRVPGAKVYVISILPISRDKSAQNEYGCNKERIDYCNGLIKKMADDIGIKYVDAGSAIADKNGYLPDEASPDGCHLGKAYTRKWLEYTARNM